MHILEAKILGYCMPKNMTADFIGATTVGTGGDWSPTFRLGTDNVLVPQLFGRSFQKARNSAASIVTSQ